MMAVLRSVVHAPQQPIPRGSKVRRWLGHLFREWTIESWRPIAPAFAKPEPSKWTDTQVTLAWLGHSTVLLNFYGMTILTDPVLGKRAGADTLVGTIGAKRLIAPALKVRQLPAIDLVLLSHAHMDHMDLATLRALPGRPRVVTAHNTIDLLQSTHLKEPKALKWGQSARVSTEHGDATVSAFEVKHWGARWKVDKYRGYNGYVVQREGKKIIFGGDTAWKESFRSLRSQGPFELALMPIGAYRPWINSHCTPEQAVRMANDAGAKHYTSRHSRLGGKEPSSRWNGWRPPSKTNASAGATSARRFNSPKS